MRAKGLLLTSRPIWFWGLACVVTQVQCVDEVSACETSGEHASMWMLQVSVVTKDIGKDDSLPGVVNALGQALVRVFDAFGASLKRVATGGNASLALKGHPSLPVSSRHQRLHVRSLTQVGQVGQVDGSVEARTFDASLCNATSRLWMFVLINGACVALVLAGVAFTMGLSLVTDEKSLSQVMPGLLSHAYDFQKHAHSMFVRVDEGTAARLSPLDGIRAMAFILVTYSHWKKVVMGTGAIFRGHLGIWVFFVLSGFLIPMVLLSLTKRTKSSVLEQFPIFRFQRFLRIWPSYNAFVPLASVCYGFMDSEFVAQACASNFWTFFGDVLWTPFLCINNIIPGRSANPFGHLWTVSSEMQMYLITPLMVATYYQSHYAYIGYSVALLVLLGCLAASSALDYDPSGAPGYVWETLPFYLCGMLTSYSYMDSDESKSGCKGSWWVLDPLRGLKWRAVAVVIVSVLQGGLAFVAVSLSLLPGSIQGMMLTAVCIAVFMRLVLDPDLGSLGAYVFGSWLFYPLASLSYTGYLCSMLGPEIAKTLGFGRNLIGFLGSTTIVLLLAFFLSLLVERPFMSLRATGR